MLSFSNSIDETKLRRSWTRMKVRYHFIRGDIQKRDIAIEFVGTSDQLANILESLSMKTGFAKWKDN